MRERLNQRRALRAGAALAALIAVLMALIGMPPASAGASGVQFGSLVATRGNETFAQAVARQDATYGTPTPMPISRVFYNGAPQPWPGDAGASGRPVVVSFRYAPAKVVAGQYDAAIAAFFRTAPSYDVYWSFSHEPEDNVARGEFTAADYRAAWEHIAAIATLEAPPTANLHSTLILMCYTMNPASRRNWLNYYVPTAQSMIAFDCYDHAAKRGKYWTASGNSFKPLTDWAAQNPTIPWGVSEVGNSALPATPPVRGEHSGSARSALSCLSSTRRNQTGPRCLGSTST